MQPHSRHNLSNRMNSRFLRRTRWKQSHNSAHRRIGWYADGRHTFRCSGQRLPLVLHWQLLFRGWWLLCPLQVLRLRDITGRPTCRPLHKPQQNHRIRDIHNLRNWLQAIPPGLVRYEDLRILQTSWRRRIEKLRRWLQSLLMK